MDGDDGEERGIEEMVREESVGRIEDKEEEKIRKNSREKERNTVKGLGEARSDGGNARERRDKCDEIRHDEDEDAHLRSSTLSP